MHTHSRAHTHRFGLCSVNRGELPVVTWDLRQPLTRVLPETPMDAQLDYLFYRTELFHPKTMKVRAEAPVALPLLDAAGRDLSDHYALVATLRLREAEPLSPSERITRQSSPDCLLVGSGTLVKPGLGA